jgi:alpha-N-arabinofuranosidase
LPVEGGGWKTEAMQKPLPLGRFLVLLPIILALGNYAMGMSENVGEKTSLEFDFESVGAPIAPEIYGHFAEHLGSCIYGGIWVGEDSQIPNTRGIRNDVLEALRALEIPVLRWPGGCFADEYHWRDGIGPRAERPGMINTTWGKVVENNHFGTHEFFDLVELLGTQAYVCGNVGSGTVQEMMEWVEYMTSNADSPVVRERRANGREAPWKLDYFGVGNESWGCGGNMRPEYYADLYRRYSTFVKNYGKDRIYRIACGSNDFNLHWTEVLMERAGDRMDGLSLHYYTLPTGNWKDKGPATGFAEDAYRATIARAFKMRDIVEQHGAIMDTYDPQKRVGMIVDEWGVWTNVEPGTNPAFLYQQNSMRDAMVAGLHFKIFHEHSDRIHMANIAQTVNVLQAMVLTDGPRMLRTPTYWVFEMFKAHQGNQHLPLVVHSPKFAMGEQTVDAVQATASMEAGTQTVQLSLMNLDPANPTTVSIPMDAGYTVYSARILSASTVDAHNTFEEPDRVRPQTFSGCASQNGEVLIDLPALSIVMVELRN